MKIKHIDELQEKLDSKVNVYDIIKESDFASNSDTKIPTQKAVKAYIDNLSINSLADLIEINEIFYPTETINIGETLLITLTNAPLLNYNILITINGVYIDSTKYLLDSNEITLYDLEYLLDVNDKIIIYYKYA